MSNKNQSTNTEIEIKKYCEPKPYHKIIENTYHYETELPDDHCCSHKKYTNNVKLDVIVVISNPIEYDKRYTLFNETCNRFLKEPQIRLTTVELQQKNRRFATNATIKIRTSHELWYKENLINIAISRLPCDWEYVAWIDADIQFTNKNWVRDTIEELQSFEVVQMFSHCNDLGPYGVTLQIHTGFAYQYKQYGEWMRGRGYTYYHPGYCCAYTRKAIDAIGGMLDFAIFGSADFHMWGALIGEVDRTLIKELHPNYILLCKIFEQRCLKHIKKNIGFVYGTILHHFHSCKSSRKYGDRKLILARLQFDPLVHIKKNSIGLYQLEDDCIELRDEIMLYNRARDEDSTDLHQDYPFVKKKFF